MLLSGCFTLNIKVVIVNVNKMVRDMEYLWIRNKLQGHRPMVKKEHVSSVVVFRMLSAVYNEQVLAGNGDIIPESIHPRILTLTGSG